MKPGVLVACAALLLVVVGVVLLTDEDELETALASETDPEAVDALDRQGQG